jgi:CDP-diacylglycerol---serine O-phosphatidyltransferase
MTMHGLYILPSLFTAANLVMGFVSILFSIHGQFSAASWAIIAAIIMDALDGRVARWTKSTSSFGIEFDSLADLVSFGIAPSILMYQMVLQTMNKPGITIALFYVVAGALRLARFNIKAHEGALSTHFIGLPIPAAAGILASFALSYELFESGQEITVKTIPLIMAKMPFFFKSIPVLMVIISFLMISSVPYAAMKNFKLNRPKSFQLFTLFVIGIMLIITYPQNTIFIIFLLYLLSGIMGYVWRYIRLRQSLSLSARLKKNSGDFTDFKNVK